MTLPPTERKGARRRSEIAPDLLAALEQGEIPTVNLVEFLAVDLARLLPAIAQRQGLDPQQPQLLATVNTLSGLKPMQRHAAIARTLQDLIGDQPERLRQLATQPSDIARQWAALMVGLRPEMPLQKRLSAIRPFAADPHFAVREMAWMSMRDAVAQDIPDALHQLQPWVHEDDANLRRFASELTRPRGVWCRHLNALKNQPELARPLLDPLRADPSRYVQDSVGNWLNDAGKSCPEWTRAVCADWLSAGDTPATRAICRRGLRSLGTTP